MKKIVYTLGLIPAISMAMTSPFVDISTNHEFKAALDFVQSEGIVSGYADGTFKPDTTINRAELTKILAEAQLSSSLENCTTTDFPDVPANAWFAPYVCAAVKAGVVAGYPDGTYKPAQTVNVAEASKMIVNSFRLEAASTDGAWFEGYLEVLGNKGSIPVGISAVDAGLTRGQMAEIIFRLKTETTDKPSKVYSENKLMVKVMTETTTETSTESKMTDQNEAGMESNTNLEVEAEVSTEVSTGMKAETMNQEAALYTDYSAAKEMEVKGKQTYALYFKADWCPVCALFEKNLKENLTNFPDGTVILKADYDAETELKAKYNVNHQTTFVVIDSEGEVLFNEVNPDIEPLKSYWQ